MTVDPTRVELSRRDALRSGLLGLAALGIAGLTGGAGCASRSGASAAGGPAVAATGRTRLLRLAHLTDWHIQPEKGAFEGVAACLRHCQSLADRPQLIVSGGDLIMDGFAADHARTKAQWDLFNAVLRDECSLPVEHTIGNHDIWGWDKTKSRTTGSEPGWGKRWACEMIGREKPYAVRDLPGVRLVVLDSVHTDPRDGEGYIGRLDEEQFDWLERTLRDTPPTTPVIVSSHISIVTATVFGPSKGKILDDDHRINLGVMHADAPRLMELFERHPNVKACLSGHMHLLDRVELRGVTYLCNGAVSGSWWNGPRGTLPEGYAVVDLFSDGSVEREYVAYGWTARKA
jgi:3',5'-cyclic AMP phosphodiesterase CpdA